MAAEPKRFPIVRPRGLRTQPNPFSDGPAGGLKRAINCVMRDPNVLASAPRMFSSQACGNADAMVVHKMMPLDAGHVYTFCSGYGNVPAEWEVRENNNNVSLLPGYPTATCDETNLFSATGRISPVRANERMLVNSANGILVGDFMAPTTGTQRNLRLAGLPQPQVQRGGETGYNNYGPIPGNVVCNYAVILTRKMADGYTLVSPPSPILKYIAPTSTSYGYAPYFYVSWKYDVVQEGDIFELYRSDGIEAVTLATEASTVLKLVGAFTVISTGVFQFRIDDRNKMGDAPLYTTSGEQLYCNPGQGGDLSINRQPPVCQAMEVFDGRVFYANTAERPFCSFSIPAGVGRNSNGTPITDEPYWLRYGIGSRSIPGLSWTNGNPVITGYSQALYPGIVPGQRFYGGAFAPHWPAGGVVTAVTATTITMSPAPSATGSGTLTFADVIYIGFNGGALAPYRFDSLTAFMAAISGYSYEASPAVFELTSNTAIPLTGYASIYNDGVSMTIEPFCYGSPFITMQVTATNGANYSPALAEYNTTPRTYSRTLKKNHVTWSKDQQPEHVPPGSGNETFIGNREIINLKATKDALWFACLDGIFRLTGQNGEYSVLQIDESKIICAPQAMCTLDEQVYVYTNFGIFQLDSETRINITDTVIGDLLPGPEYKEISTIQMVENEGDLEIVLLDVASKAKLYVYGKRDFSAWTTLENNSASLQNITALAYQRSPASGDARVLVGVSPVASTPSYAGWGDTSGFLIMDVQFQPIYLDDPISLKHWIEASYIFDDLNAGKQLRPIWNGAGSGFVNIVKYENGTYGRAGVPRSAQISQNIAPGFDLTLTASPATRFLGISVLYLDLTKQAKQRT